jgi:hypothetical protein
MKDVRQVHQCVISVFPAPIPMSQSGDMKVSCDLFSIHTSIDSTRRAIWNNVRRLLERF